MRPEPGLCRKDGSEQAGRLPRYFTFARDEAEQTPTYQYETTLRDYPGGRHSAKAVLHREVAHLLELPTQRPSGRASVSYHDFTCRTQGRFRRVEPELSTQQRSPLLPWPWYGGAMIRGGQVRPESDQAVMLACHRGNIARGLALPEAIKRPMPTSPQTRLIKTGG